jgi:3-hydroxy-9,10-secoandrosta-1,3,5(10)-triene-9,17-dione monooxygenase
MTSDDRHPLSHNELVTNAVALQPLLRRHAPEGHADRRLNPVVTNALTDAKMFRLLTPRRFGGLQAPLSTIVDVTAALGAADGSVAWLAGIASAGQWFIGAASERAQEEIFADGPDIRIAGNLAPVSADRADSGLHLTGRWPYAAGVDDDGWIIVAADNRHSDDPRLCLVPVGTFRREAARHADGLGVTRSATWVADRLFVPDYRTLSVSAVVDGASPDTDREVYRLPCVPFVGALLLGPLLGIGSGAIALALETTKLEPMVAGAITSRSGVSGVQLQISDAAARLEMARVHAHRIADELDRAVAAGSSVNRDDRSFLRAECIHTTRQILEAIAIVGTMFKSESLDGYQRILQYWRTANTAARYARLDAAVGDGLTGMILLDIRAPISTAAGLD